MCVLMLRLQVPLKVCAAAASACRRANGCLVGATLATAEWLIMIWVLIRCLLARFVDKRRLLN